MRLEGQCGLVLGVANSRSIAWAIARAAADAGAQLALTYAGEKLEAKVRRLAEELESPLILPCDVQCDDDIDQVFRTIEQEWGRLNFLVHSVAFAKAEDLAGDFVETSRDGYHLAQDISAYSLVALSRRAAPLMEQGGSIVAMTYLGSVRVIPRYNVMGVAKAALESAIRYLASDLGHRGVRVNGISAGPVNTLAARGIRNFSEMLQVVAEKSPLRRNIEVSEVAETALFLLGPGSSGITGEIIHVDAGYHILGM